MGRTSVGFDRHRTCVASWQLWWGSSDGWLTPTQDETYDKHDEEYEKENPRNIGSRAGKPAEPQCCRDQSDDQENKRPAQHGFASKCLLCGLSSLCEVNLPSLGRCNNYI
jgi:hypothetical protein